MLKRTKTKIEIGDKFVKADDPGTIWIVAGHGSSVALAPHFQVVREGYASRLRTLSEQVLLDKDFYLRVD